MLLIKFFLRKVLVKANSFSLRFRLIFLGSWISLESKVNILPGGKIKIGKGVRIAKNSVISVLPGAKLEINDNSLIGHGVTIYCSKSIIVGKNCRIAHYCSIIDHDYEVNSKTINVPWGDKSKISKRIFIADNVWLGAHVVILKGVSIGKNCIIGASALVSVSIKENLKAYSSSASKLKLKKL